MTLAEILTELIARGVRADIIAEISCVFSEKGFADRVRAQTKARVRNYRERVTLRNGTVTLPKPAYIEDSKIQESKKEKKDISRKRPKTSLPADFKPDLKTQLHASALSISDENFAREVEGFKRSAVAHGRVYADWQAACQNWMDTFASGKFAGQQLKVVSNNNTYVPDPTFWDRRPKPP